MKRKKLLYIGNALWHKAMTPTTIHTLSQNLREAGYDVTVASHYHSKPVRLIHMLYSVVIARNKVDAVLIDTYSTANFWYAVWVARCCRFFALPYYPILHGGNLPQRLESNKLASRKLFGKARLNIAPSKFLLQAFAKAKYDNLIHIPNSIVLEDYPYRERHHLQPRLLWVRAFADIYNPMMALEVYEQLLADYPEARLTMVGPEKDTSFQQCVTYAEKKGLEVSFTGRLSKKEWISLSNEHDIFLNTTTVDNTPVSLIEAMALGLPIVSTEVGGIPYLVSDQKEALLVGSNKAKQMTAAVKQLLQKPELAMTLSQSGRQKVAAFDWAVVKTLWKEVLS